MADNNLKALESERRLLWSTCRLKGLAADTPERTRITGLDEKITALKTNGTFKARPEKNKKRAPKKGAKSGGSAGEKPQYRTYGKPAVKADPKAE